MRDARQMNYRPDISEQRAPFDRTRQIRDGNHLDRPGENISRLAHRRAHRMSNIGEFGDEGAANKTRCAGHECARHSLPQAKTIQRQPSSTRRLCRGKPDAHPKQEQCSTAAITQRLL
jgi:hypothetical protein